MTWLSALVRYFTRCKYNHCAVIVMNWGVPFINEALGHGVVSRPAAVHLERSKTKIMIIRPTQPQFEQFFCVRANSKLGTPYDRCNLTYQQLIYRRTGLWIGKKGKGAEKHMVCSEYVAWCHQLEKWWLSSTKEVMNHDGFEIFFVE
jgi:hypothetical protein